MNNCYPNEQVNHPTHYQGDGGLEAIKAIEGIFGKQKTADWCLITAFKYLCRMGKKDKISQDTDKAIWYLNKFKELSA